MMGDIMDEIELENGPQEPIGKTVEISLPKQKQHEPKQKKEVVKGEVKQATKQKCPPTKTQAKKAAGIALLGMTPIVLGLFIYLFYSKIPECCNEPWALRYELAKLRLQHYLAKSGEFFGHVTYINITRLLMEYGANTYNDQDIKVTPKIFNGVLVKVYQPHNQVEDSRGIVFFHDGGWVSGSVDISSYLTASLAWRLNATVVSVEYRLSPEYGFPTPIFDCEMATRFFFKFSNRFNVDRERIALFGAGSGGNLATAVAIKLAQEFNAPRPKLQILLYPSLQGLDFHLPSYQKYSSYMPELNSRKGHIKNMLAYMKIQDDSIVEEALNNNHTAIHIKHIYNKHLNVSELPQEYNLDGFGPLEYPQGNPNVSRKIESYLINGYFSPLVNNVAEKLPQTYITASEYDIRRDETIMYVEKLRKANVSVTFNFYKCGYPRMLDFFGRLKSADKYYTDMIEYLKKHL